MRPASANPAVKEVGEPVSSENIKAHTRKPRAASEGALSDELKKVKSAVVSPSSPPGGRGPDSFDEAKTNATIEHPHPALHRVGSNLSASFSTADNDEVEGGSVGTSASSDDPLKLKSRKSRKKRTTKATESSKSVGSPHPLSDEPLLPTPSNSKDPPVTESAKDQSHATSMEAGRAADQVEAKSKPQFAPATSSKVITRLPKTITENRSLPILPAKDRGDLVPRTESETPRKSTARDFSSKSPAAKQPSSGSVSAPEKSKPERIEGTALSDAESSQTLKAASEEAADEPPGSGILTPSPSKSEAAESVAQASSHAAQTLVSTEPTIPKKTVKPKGPAQTEALNPFAGQKARRDAEKKAAKAQRKKDKLRAAANVAHQKGNGEAVKSKKSIDTSVQAAIAPAVKEEEADVAAAADAADVAKKLLAWSIANSQPVPAPAVEKSEPAAVHADISQSLEEAVQRADREHAAPADAPAPLTETNPNITKPVADADARTEAVETSAKVSPPKKQKRKPKKKAVAAAEAGPSTVTVAKENTVDTPKTADIPNTYPVTGGSGSK